MEELNQNNNSNNNNSELVNVLKEIADKLVMLEEIKEELKELRKDIKHKIDMDNA